MARPDDPSEQKRVWQQLVDAGLIDIPPEQFPDRVKEAKHVVIGRLSELLNVPNDVQERESAAYSLATLKKLESTLGKTEYPLSPEDLKRHS